MFTTFSIELNFLFTITVYFIYSFILIKKYLKDNWFIFREFKIAS